MSRIPQRLPVRPMGMRTSLFGGAIVVIAAATLATTMPDTATPVTPLQPEREARLIEAVMRDLPDEYRGRSVAMDPRWAPLPGGEAAADVLVDENDVLGVQHADAIGPHVFEELEARGLTPILCEGGLDFVCIGEFGTVHLVFAKPSADPDGASILVLLSGRTSPDSDRATFQVWEYDFELDAESVEPGGRSRIMQGHGRVPGSLPAGRR